MDFKLVTLDLDGTLFIGNSVLYLRERFGLSKNLEEQHAKFASGKISEVELNLLQIPLLKGVKLTPVLEVLSQGPLLSNIEEGVRILKRSSLEVAMLTFNPLQLLFERKFGIRCDVSKTVDVENDQISRINEIPENKVVFLKRFCNLNGIDLRQCIHVGDAPNDIPTFKEAGFSVAINSKSVEARKAANLVLDTEDFETVAQKIVEGIGSARTALF